MPKSKIMPELATKAALKKLQDELKLWRQIETLEATVKPHWGLGDDDNWIASCPIKNPSKTNWNTIQVSGPTAFDALKKLVQHMKVKVS